mmetsp:Transcript_18088/g.21662  ORF Transcript_18088/g.21662 Transcript_18088/m.21662 type:complete len:91 (-) Transcript_18088:527-799(-)
MEMLDKHFEMVCELSSSMTMGKWSSTCYRLDEPITNHANMLPSHVMLHRRKRNGGVLYTPHRTSLDKRRSVTIQYCIPYSQHAAATVPEA